MKKRALVLFTLLLFILSGVVLQVYRLSDAYLSQAADQQGSVTVKVANSRGTIYDARLRPLTNAGEEYRLSVTPSPEAIAALSGMLDEEQLAAVSERLQSGKPAVVTLPEIPANLEGSLLFKVPVRVRRPPAGPPSAGLYGRGRSPRPDRRGAGLRRIPEQLRRSGVRHLFGGCHGQAAAGDRAPGGQHPG